MTQISLEDKKNIGDLNEHMLPHDPWNVVETAKLGYIHEHPGNLFLMICGLRFQNNIS